MIDLVESGLLETQRMISEISPHAKTTLYKADVSDEESVKAMISKCVETYGRLDFACNNAGIAMANIATTETDLRTFDKIHNVNFRGVSIPLKRLQLGGELAENLLQVYLCQKYEVMAMLKQEPLPGIKRAARGSIVNTSSLSGVAALGGFSAYHSSKHAVISMTRVDARQYGGQGIRINCVCPGVVDTPLLRSTPLSDKFIELSEAQAPMKRLINPEEIADGVTFLHGNGASSVTGVHLPIDGGALLFHVV
jgi:NAD(P)-dependent dehydrogenase (short-subunit alcohol dehydrogenase family)